MAAMHLRNFGEAAKKAMPTLVEMVSTDKDPNARIHAAYALASMGEVGIGKLVGVIKDENSEEVRASAMQALMNFGNRSKATLPVFIDALKDKSPRIRWTAAQGLSQMGTNARAAVPALAEALKDKHTTVRDNASFALINIGPDGYPPLFKSLSIKDSNYRQNVLQNLVNRRAGDKDAVPVLITCLKDKNAQVRWLACQLLGNIGPDARAAVQALKAASNDSNQTVRQQAQAALKRIE